MGGLPAANRRPCSLRSEPAADGVQRQAAGSFRYAAALARKPFLTVRDTGRQGCLTVHIRALLMARQATTEEHV